MKQIINIDGREISPNHAPYIIAEMSANHNGKIENAFYLLESAKKSGADAVKIQTYTADTLTLDSNLPDFQITEGLWQGKSLYELYESAHTPWDWHPELFDYARRLGITLFSSPFDNTAVDLLEDLNAPAYKIASFEIVDHGLIRYAASTGKPLFISTGMANQDEIEEAIEVALEAGCQELAVLLCVSAYPADAKDYNLATLTDMQNRYEVLVGLSDHTLGNTTAIASIALGARIVEKHFTLSRANGGPDDSFSIEPPQLDELVKECHTAWQAIGKADYRRKQGEKDNIKFRRSLYFVSNLSAGDTITDTDIRSIRPGFGLKPKYDQEVVGAILLQDVVPGTPVSWELLKLR
ncbi:MAG: pseudaminic acid synthase [Pseudomonadota bacterium]